MEVESSEQVLDVSVIQLTDKTSLCAVLFETQLHIFKTKISKKHLTSKADSILTCELGFLAMAIDEACEAKVATGTVYKLKAHSLELLDRKGRVLQPRELAAVPSSSKGKKEGSKANNEVQMIDA